MIDLWCSPVVFEGDDLLKTQEIGSETFVVGLTFGLFHLILRFSIEDDSEGWFSEINSVDAKYSFYIDVQACFFFGFSECCHLKSLIFLDCASDDPPF